MLNNETQKYFCPDCGAHEESSELWERRSRQLAEADARTLAGAVRRMHRQLIGLEESELGNENKKLRELASRVISDLSKWDKGNATAWKYQEQLNQLTK